MFLRQKPFAKGWRMCPFAKNNSRKIGQHLSSTKTIPQRFANDSPLCHFAKDSLMCQFAKNHSPETCQRFAKVSVRQKPSTQRFANVSPRQKSFPKDSPKIRQRVSSPKTIPQRFAKDSPTCQFAKNNSLKIRQRVS